ncbi:MAG: hypothetical protein JW888_10400 [Pirellulales bacterium]|nr:hypothetical protein [Pirellulales bacterium]
MAVNVGYDIAKMMNCQKYRYAACLLCVAVIAIAGCDRSGPELVPARGTITLNGGAWPARGVIYCNPIECPDGFPKRPCSGFFDAGGNLTFKTFEEGDGIIPGTYAVSVECWKTEPLSPSGRPAESYVPRKYESGMTSGLEIKVEPGQDKVEVHFDVVGTSGKSS